ncbi:MAG: peptide chain release factor 1 [Chloroflexi bacterium]|nr:peptide chain release factor 1 [Chloroflexota bacterium]MCY4247330.1 peptide chain release factor 1 [Chloroflexota bacterium]
MLDKLAEVESRYLELEALMGDPAIAGDYERVADLAKERASLQAVVDAFRLYKRQADELAGARELLELADDAEMRELAQDEIASLQASASELLERLRLLLLPKDPRDSKDVIVEIRAGAGGDEAGIFAGDLLRLYTRYAEGKRWRVELLDVNEQGNSVFKNITFQIKGAGAFSRLKYESGVHRVQRVPTTESQGRIHTSTATVAVLAEMDEVDVQLDMSDVETQVFRARGAGGQSVNTTDSAVRLIHKPTGVVVEMQDERSQLQNKLRAKQVLIARLYDAEVERQRSEREAERRGQVGSGDRSEKIRTYNFPQGRVTDHRIGFSSYNLPAVMDGALDAFIDQLATQEQARQLAAGSGE